MKDRIIAESIASLRQNGLRFSVDSLAENLRISKKTVYKYFPSKEALALAIYDVYFSEAISRAASITQSSAPSVTDLLHLYYDAKVMVRSEIFNKYRLNESIHSYVSERNDALWQTVSEALFPADSAEEQKPIRIIVDGVFEKLCNESVTPDSVIERMKKLL